MRAHGRARIRAGPVTGLGTARHGSGMRAPTHLAGAISRAGVRMPDQVTALGRAYAYLIRERPIGGQRAVRASTTSNAARTATSAMSCVAPLTYTPSGMVPRPSAAAAAR